MGREGPVVGVGGVLVDDRGRLLVVQRGNPPAQHRWTLPGGRVERDERLAEAVVRELREETGLEVEVGDMVGLLERISDDGHYLIVDFHVRRVRGELRAGDDAADVAFVTRSELERRVTTHGLLAFLDEHGVELAP